MFNSNRIDVKESSKESSENIIQTSHEELKEEIHVQEDLGNQLDPAQFYNEFVGELDIN